VLTTGCEGCCFLKQDTKGRGCGLHQLCVVKDNRIYAPGYCRLCRSRKWAEKHGTTDIEQLCKHVIDECSLEFDMLVFFDESIHHITDLQRTLNSDWYLYYAKNIIIMDVTGFGKRNNSALQYLRSKSHIVPTIVDSSVNHETSDQREATIRRLSKQVKSPFFLVIDAGTVLHNLDVFAKKIQNIPTRVIHWSFPHMIGATTIVSHKLDHGLFVTIPYRALTQSPEILPDQSIVVKSFTEELRKEEIETSMGLSRLETNCRKF